MFINYFYYFYLVTARSKEFVVIKNIIGNVKKIQAGNT